MSPADAVQPETQLAGPLTTQGRPVQRRREGGPEWPSGHTAPGLGVQLAPTRRQGGPGLTPPRHKVLTWLACLCEQPWTPRVPEPEALRPVRKSKAAGSRLLGAQGLVRRAAWPRGSASPTLETTLPGPSPLWQGVAPPQTLQWMGLRRAGLGLGRSLQRPQGFGRSPGTLRSFRGEAEKAALGEKGGRGL